MNENSSTSELNSKIEALCQELEEIKELWKTIDSLNYWLSRTSKTNRIQITAALPDHSTITFTPNSKKSREDLLITLGSLHDSLLAQYKDRVENLLSASAERKEE